MDDAMERGEGDEFNRTLLCFNDEPLDLFIMEKYLLYRDDVKDLPFTVMRLVYLYHILKKINEERRRGEGGAGSEFVAAVSRLIQRQTGGGEFRPIVAETDETFSVWLGKTLKYSSPKHITRLFKILEKESRGQSANIIWHALRMNTISGTKFYNALFLGTLTLGVEPTFQAAHAEGVHFGLAHEGLVRALLERYVAWQRPALPGGLGLLIDPTTGLLGASLDVCFGVDKDAAGLISVEAGSLICEIKCRYKYLRARDDPAVRALLRRPDKDTFAAFILSHRIPGIEYRDVGEAPSVREFLLTRDRTFNNRKRSRPGQVPELLKPYLSDLLYLNESEQSEVIIFDTDAPDDEESRDGEIGAAEGGAASAKADGGDPGDPGGDLGDLGDPTRPASEPPPFSERDDGPPASAAAAWEESPEAGGSSAVTTTLGLRERTRFRLPVFANPRHPYYFQTLVQQYVLSQYYIRGHPNPEYILVQDLPRVRLVSAILRERGPHEIGKRLDVAGQVFDCAHLPLAIIVTPVVFDPTFNRDVLLRVLNRWEREVGRRTGLPIWVPNAVNDYVTSSTPRPPTP
ncbi:T98 [Tupaiid betaherpesvirus 1]|uniref:T98 n=1 Tax=Tupaiid herpesvirus 1 (strain 1) TaxID=10397 RepID=Q91TK6_TUHV1|nr:T98 [Tupaiid betaherpesvirus 1]AAK57141.1 T98 [Tupaiid betaherpesvirus 1]